MLTRRLFQAGCLATVLPGAAFPATSAAPPILLGIDAEFELQNSTSAQAVLLGVQVAVDEINAAGGLLGGRPLAIVQRDHRSIPARGIRNIGELAAMNDLVAIFGGRFSPVVLEELPSLRQAKVPFLAVWSAADGIVDNGTSPNYAFRLSLRDSLAMPFLMDVARRRGLQRVGLLLTNTGWGRSNMAAAEKHAATHASPRIVATDWYNWQEHSLLNQYGRLRQHGAEAILLVANDDEAAVLVKEVAAQPAARRIPILSHWGVTGGQFVQSAGPALHQVDFSVVQTFSFFQARPAPLARFMAAAGRHGVRRIEDIVSPVGVAHAYDMTHILARAIRLAGSTDRVRIRDALERVPFHDGLVKRYAPPFTASRHEALGPDELLLARYRADGVLVPVKA